MWCCVVLCDAMYVPHVLYVHMYHIDVMSSHDGDAVQQWDVLLFVLILY
jgi:hypothetical protein